MSDSFYLSENRQLQENFQLQSAINVLAQNRGAIPSKALTMHYNEEAFLTGHALCVCVCVCMFVYVRGVPRWKGMYYNKAFFFRTVGRGLA